MIWLRLLNFTKDNARPISYGVLLVIIVILFLLWRSDYTARIEAEAGRDASIKISNELGKIARKYRNKQGDSVTISKAIVIPKSQVDELLHQKDLQWLKKLEGVKKDGRNLQSAETFTIEFQENLVAEKIKYLPCKDSIKSFAFDLHDQWNDIHALVIDTPKFEIRDRYYAAIEVQRPKAWFWKGLKHLNWGKQWEPISEITNSNKLIKIDSMAVIIVK